MIKSSLKLFIATVILLTGGKLFAQNLSQQEIGNLLTQANAKASSLTKSAVTYTVSDAYTDAPLGLSHLYLQQTHQNIKVLNVMQSLVFKNNQLQFQSGKFITDIAAKAGSSTPIVTAADAIGKVAKHLSLNNPTNLTEVTNSFAQNKKITFTAAGIAKENIHAELVWASNDDYKTVQLAWNVTIDVLGSSDVWNVRVNAKTGSIINQDNLTIYENNEPANASFDDGTSPVEATRIVHSINQKLTPIPMAPPPTPGNFVYNVIPFPYENRFVGNIALETNPWLKAGVDNNATTYGWNYDGTTNYTYTRGNNVHAYDDSLNKNAPGRAAFATTTMPDVVFNYTPNFNLPPTDPINRNFATTNLFYWNNVMHDVFYQYGFTEPAGNFQMDNMGRGGLAGDYIHAEAQDGSGTNNANFYAPVDGISGRMQMYLYKPAYGFATINSPSNLVGVDTVKESNVSKYNLLRNVGAVTGQVVFYNDDVAGTIHQACTASPVNNLQGNIAFFNSSNCSYITKIKNAQNAGAIGVIVGRTSGSAIVMGGTDTTITIPAVMVSSVDGNKIIAELNKGSVVNVTLNSGIRFDGDLDDGVMSHEYTHGISIRLTGGPGNSSCLSNKEQGGEGWSDYVGMMMNTDWSTAQLADAAKVHTHAAYVTNQTPIGVGNRTSVYSTDTTIDKHSYKDLANTTYKGEVHYIGEVWATVLWDMTWNIIKQEGTINPNLYDAKGVGGNTLALQLVVTGMKLQPCKPGFLDARDAILAADSILYNYKHKCAIWNAFARRGMGLSAAQGSADSCGDEIVAYDVPVCQLPLQLISFTGSKVQSGVNLNWKTLNEVNAKDFGIEYSIDGNTWQAIGTIVAENAATATYTFTHNLPVEGTNYYRLKMSNKDGSYTYSSTVSIEAVNTHSFYSIYPNPVKDNLFVQLKSSKAQTIVLSVTDIQGKLLQRQTQKVGEGQSSISINTNNLAKGSYILVIKGDKTAQQVFVKE